MRNDYRNAKELEEKLAFLYTTDKHEVKEFVIFIFMGFFFDCDSSRCMNQGLLRQRVYLKILKWFPPYSPRRVF